MGFHFFNRNKFIMAAVSAFTAAMVLFPHVTETGFKSAFLIWLNSVVPILLPFFIIADFIKRTGNLEMLPPKVYPFAAAVLSGYPMGAKASADMLRMGRLNPEEGKWVLSYAMVTGPAFLLGTIGAFLGNQKAAVIVTAAHYGGAMVNGILWRMTLKKGGELPEREGKGLQKKSKRENGEEGLPEAFSKSILAGFQSMAFILAYLMLFMIGMNLMEMAGVFRWIGNEAVSSVIKGLLEMTAGSGMISACNISLQEKIILISALVSFGGLSVIGQSASIAGGAGIRLSDILLRKGTHGAAAAILAVFLTGIMI